MRRGLGRAQRKKYQELYRREYVRSHGGGEAGKEVLRARNRQQKRSSRSMRYLPLLFETVDHRYRLWTWQGPSKLFLESVQEPEGMRDLFIPRLRPKVIPYTTDVNRDLRSACKAAAAGIPFQGLSDQESRAYAFLLWNECRGYEYLTALDGDRVPSAEDAPFRLVSQLLVEALTRPLAFVRFLAETIRPSVDEFVRDVQASEAPLDRSDFVDKAILRFPATLAAAHSYLVASGLTTSPPGHSSEYRKWFHRQVRRTERTEPALHDDPVATPFEVFAEDAVLPDLVHAPAHAGDGRSRRPKSVKGQPKRKQVVKGRGEHTPPRRTVKK